MANYYEQIDELQKKQIEEALLSLQAQEQAALLRLEQKKALAKENYNLALSGAFSDYSRASNPYGYENESIFASGLGNSGKSETAKALNYNAYASLLGSLHKDYTAELTELDLQGSEIKAAAQKEKGEAQRQAYNALLQELIRRQENEREDLRFEYEKEQDEKNYALKLASASKSYGGAYSSGNSEIQEAAKASNELLGIRTDEYDKLTEMEYRVLVKEFKYLNSSLLPGEDNPTRRIRNTKQHIINTFKHRLTNEQLTELMKL